MNERSISHNCHSLGGTYLFPQDLFLELFLQGAGGGEIDVGAHDLFQSGLQTEEFEESDPCVRQELDQDVHVAVGAGLVAGNGAEDIEVGNGEVAAQLVGAGRQALDGFVLSHEFATVMGGNEVRKQGYRKG